jgi:hypothetical protein
MLPTSLTSQYFRKDDKTFLFDSRRFSDPQASKRLDSRKCETTNTSAETSSQKGACDLHHHGFSKSAMGKKPMIYVVLATKAG